jgi:hypothetical protein
VVTVLVERSHLEPLTRRRAGGNFCAVPPLTFILLQQKVQPTIDRSGAGANSRQVDVGVNVWRSDLVCRSLANVVLAFRLILPTDVDDGSPATREVPHWDRVAIGVPPWATTQPLPKDIQPRAPFVWRDVEDEDYRVYIANLRAVGCPEVLIRDLVAAELAQSFMARAPDLWRPRKLEYWQKYEPAPDDQAEADLSQYKMLVEEHDAVLEELFGPKHIQDAWFALRDLQLQDSERTLAFLPELQHQAAVRALAVAQLDEFGLERNDGTEVDRDALFKMKYDALSQVLSPAELDELRSIGCPETTIRDLMYCRIGRERTCTR